MNQTAIPADTILEAALVQTQVYRRMSGEERLLLALEMGDTLREIVADGVRHHHPEYSEEEVRLTVIRRCLGDELFREAFPQAKLPK